MDKEWSDGIERRLQAVETYVSETKDDIATILKVVGGASKYGRIIKVHGPRVFAAFVGWLIATGRIDVEFARLLNTILFG